MVATKLCCIGYFDLCFMAPEIQPRDSRTAPKRDPRSTGWTRELAPPPTAEPVPSHLVPAQAGVGYPMGAQATETWGTAHGSWPYFEKSEFRQSRSCRN